MKKKYTKKQIQEAISYWKYQLKVLNESVGSMFNLQYALSKFVKKYPNGYISCILNEDNVLLNGFESFDDKKVFKLGETINDKSKYLISIKDFLAKASKCRISSMKELVYDKSDIYAIDENGELAKVFKYEQHNDIFEFHFVSIDSPANKNASEFFDF